MLELRGHLGLYSLTVCPSAHDLSIRPDCLAGYGPKYSSVGLLCPFLTSCAIPQFVFRPNFFLHKERDRLVSVNFSDALSSFLELSPVLLNTILMPVPCLCYLQK